MKREDLILYAVTDRSWLGEESLYGQVEKALRGGASFVQLREKALDEEHFLQEAVTLRELCRRWKVPFVINDNVDIAVACDADGVHVGQSDMESGLVREKLGPGKIIGVSCETVEQALQAQKNGADYLGVGAMFPTGTKTDAAAVTYEALREICLAVEIPVVAIGGIQQENITLLRGSGIAGIAVISAVFSQPDIELACRRLRKTVMEIL